MSQEIVDIPKLRYSDLDGSEIRPTNLAELTILQRQSPGIMANLLAQYILTKTIKTMAIGSKCDNTELANMITYTISTNAIRQGSA